MTITHGTVKKPVKHYSTSAGGLFLSGLSLSDNMSVKYEPATPPHLT